MVITDDLHCLQLYPSVIDAESNVRRYDRVL
jgi:hypothetical protein